MQLLVQYIGAAWHKNGLNDIYSMDLIENIGYTIHKSYVVDNCMDMERHASSLSANWIKA